MMLIASTVMMMLPAQLTEIAESSEPAAPDKSAHHLFNPTPRELMRPMATDRPDTTESPYTVDAGHVQLEMSFVDYARNGGERSITAAPFNLKLGLLNNADLQLIFDPYVNIKSDDLPTSDGVGDTQIRLKLNLWGNDGGETALAVMPFIKFPTASDGVGNEEVEGGLIVPLAIELDRGWGLGLMAEFDFVRDDDDSGYDTEFVHTAALGREIAGAVGGYVEYIGIWSSDSGREYACLVGGGLTYALSDDLQLDMGMNVGLAGNADDLNLFAGMSVRF